MLGTVEIVSCVFDKWDKVEPAVQFESHFKLNRNKVTKCCFSPSFHET